MASFCGFSLGSSDGLDRLEESFLIGRPCLRNGGAKLALLVSSILFDCISIDVRGAACRITVLFNELRLCDDLLDDLLSKESYLREECFLSLERGTLGGIDFSYFLTILDVNSEILESSFFFRISSFMLRGLSSLCSEVGIVVGLEESKELLKIYTSILFESTRIRCSL